MKKIYFTTLGCSRNTVDSEIILQKLKNHGYKNTLNAKEADFFIVNTCGFLKEARDEAYSILDEIFKSKNKDSKVIITGCMANLYSKDLKERFPDIFSILSAGEIEKILLAMEKPHHLIDKTSYIQDGDIEKLQTTPTHLSYLKISEGCLKKCSFCIIPKIKGSLQSRSLKSILDEVKYLLDKGVFEINLIAQDLTDFAKDRKEKNALVNLIKEILKIKKDFWLRLLYVYPDELSDEFVDLIKSDERVCRYIDMPVQHINDRVLKLMRRKTSKSQIIQIYEKIKSKMPDFSFRSSIMVGFPTEVEEEFNELLEFIEKYPINNLAVFKYSNEKEAFSYTLENQVDEETKEKRFQLLTQKQYGIIQKNNKKMIGKKLIAIVDGFHKETKFLAEARSHSQAYGVDNTILINDISKIKSFGKVEKIKITDTAGYDLIGTII